MEKRLKNYLAKMEEQLARIKKEDIALQPEQQEQFLQEMLVQIGFFQHERLVHLIVTVTFAILTVVALLGCVLVTQLSLIVLVFMLLVLLIPYIRHYYILENGVQKLYTYYDKFREIFYAERN